MPVLRAVSSSMNVLTASSFVVVFWVDVCRAWSLAVLVKCLVGSFVTGSGGW